MYSVLLYNYTVHQSSDQTNKPSVWKFLRIKISEKSLTQRFDVAMTSLSSDKDKTKNWLSIWMNWRVNVSISWKGLWFKTRVGAQPLIWKSFFILMQIKLIFTRKIVHLTSFWKWRFLELGSGLMFYSSQLLTKSASNSFIQR